MRRPVRAAASSPKWSNGNVNARSSGAITARIPEVRRGAEREATVRRPGPRTQNVPHSLGRGGGAAVNCSWSARMQAPDLNPGRNTQVRVAKCEFTGKEVPSPESATRRSVTGVRTVYPFGPGFKCQFGKLWASAANWRFRPEILLTVWISGDLPERRAEPRPWSF